MIKCQLNELQRTLKVVSVLLNKPVTTELQGNDLYFYVNGQLIGVEKGLTEPMKKCPWELRYKSDKCYVIKEFLEEANFINTPDTNLDMMYYNVRSKH